MQYTYAAGCLCDIPHRTAPHSHSQRNYDRLFYLVCVGGGVYQYPVLLSLVRSFFVGVLCVPAVGSAVCWYKYKYACVDGCRHFSRFSLLAVRCVALRCVAFASCRPSSTMQYGTVQYGTILGLVRNYRTNKCDNTVLVLLEQGLSLCLCLCLCLSLSLCLSFS